MQLRDFLGKNERGEILFSEVEWLAKELDCSIHAIRKWCSGDRKQPRARYIKAMERITKGAVKPEDWIERAAAAEIKKAKQRNGK